MNTSQMPTATSNKSDQPENIFWQSMDRAAGSISAERTIGENGAHQWGITGLVGDPSRTERIQGALVAAFAGLVRGCSQHRVNDFLNNIITEARSRGDSSLEWALAVCLILTFQTRDTRGGKGEKDLSRWMLLGLWNYCPQTILKLIPLIPEYGYWKDLVLLIAEVREGGSKAKYVDLVDNCYQTLTDQLLEDIATYNKWKQKGFPDEDKPKLSLCAKYAPKEGRSFDRKYKSTKRLAKMMYPELFSSDFKKALHRFRIEVGALNRTIKTTEILMSTGQWDKIDFYLVPGKCLTTCRRAFLNLKGKKGEDLRHPDDPARSACRANLKRHMERAVQGKTKVNAGGLFLHEIIGKMVSPGGYQPVPDGTIDGDEMKLLQLQWDTLSKKYYQMFQDLGLKMDKVVVLADMSGSMGGDPILVALTMSILLSEIAPPAYRNRFLSFDTNPRWIEFREGMTLYEKVKFALASPWGGSTDFVKAHDLMIATCVKHKLDQTQIPQAMIVVSDMQWNAAGSGNGYGNYSTLRQWGAQVELDAVVSRDDSSSSYASNASYGSYGSYYKPRPTKSWQPHHELLTKAWARAGLATTGTEWKMPQQIYWNVQGGTVGFPVQADTPNTQMISGFSADLLKLVLEDRTSDYKEKPPPTPWDTFCQAVDDPRYDAVCRVIEKTREAAVFSNYTAPVRLEESSGDEESKDPDASSTASADETWDTCGDVVHEAVSKKCWSSSQVSEWLSSLGYTDATVEAVLQESVDGAVMQSVVESQDRSALEELYVTKRLGQTRIFTEWLKA